MIAFRCGRSGAARRATIAAFAAFVLSCAGFCASRAHAHAPGERVQVAYASRDTEAADLATTLRSAIDLPDISGEVQRVIQVDPRALIVAEPEPVAPLARIWVDLTGSDRALVYVVDRTWTRTFIRSIPRVPGNIALDHAQVAEVVRSAVQALQEGAVIGIAREPAPSRAAPEQAAVPASPARDRGAWFGGGVLYAVGLRASGELGQGPGLYGYGLGRLGEFGLGGVLTLQYQPHRASGAGVEARLDTLALRAGPLLEFVRTSALAPRIAIAVGADLVHIDPEVRATQVAAGDAHWAAFPVLSASLGLRAQLTRDVELSVALAADLDLVDTRYVVSGASGVRVVEDPFRVRPALVVGVGFF
jgi:hypothetical protein